MKTHYHVFVSMPGYLPDNEPEIYPNRKQAEAAAKWHADGWRDFIADHNAYYRDQGHPTEQATITGSARSGRYTIDRGEYTLPIYISIEPCTDQTCADELGDDEP